MINTFLVALNFNRLFVNLIRFICNQAVRSLQSACHIKGPQFTTTVNFELSEAVHLDLETTKHKYLG
jgi:hypothetical protein